MTSVEEYAQIYSERMIQYQKHNKTPDRRCKDNAAILQFILRRISPVNPATITIETICVSGEDNIDGPKIILSHWRLRINSMTIDPSYETDRLINKIIYSSPEEMSNKLNLSYQTRATKNSLFQKYNFQRHQDEFRSFQKESNNLNSGGDQLWGPYCYELIKNVFPEFRLLI